MLSNDMDDRDRFIVLNQIKDVGSLRAKRLLEAFGGIGGVFAAPAEHLQQVDGIGRVLAGRIVSACRDPKLPAEELRLAAQHGCEILTWRDAAYPAPLKTIPDAPMVLYMKGRWIEADATAVAIVGSRRASLAGQQWAERLAYDLALRGVTIVSGLARGIDSAAHRGSLKAGGRTLAVIGNGLSQVYPPEHAELAAQIVAHGALLSEYPMLMDPLAQNFPRRNRIISGLSLGVVVVEAAHRSGALITADCALEQGREVFAVPGRVDAATSQGTNQLLKQGARLVTSIEDVLEELRLEPVAVKVPASEPTAVEGDEGRVFDCLGTDTPTDLEALIRQSGLPAAACVTTLSRLELKRLVRQLPGKRFVRVG